jgi:membrane protein implicated in regulation of membrane protease activity
MLSLLYMLLIYCQLVIFIIFGLSVLAYMRRFFMIVDEIPSEQQRRLPVAEGGRGHPLMRRTFFEYKHAFGYAWYVMSRGRINRT